MPCLYKYKSTYEQYNCDLLNANGPTDCVIVFHQSLPYTFKQLLPPNPTPSPFLMLTGWFNVGCKIDIDQSDKIQSEISIVWDPIDPVSCISTLCILISEDLPFLLQNEVDLIGLF
jgi:hypothetical protein